MNTASVTTRKTGDMLKAAYSLWLELGYTEKYKNCIRHAFTENNLETFFTKEGIQEYEKAEAYFKKLTLKMLSVKPDSFDFKVLSAIISDEITSAQIGVFGYAPEYITQCRATDFYLSKLKSHSNSKHYAEPVLNTLIEIIKARYFESTESYSYIAVDEYGNILQFYNKKRYALDTKLLIKRSKIKGWYKEPKFNRKITNLNYVYLREVND